MGVLKKLTKIGNSYGVILPKGVLTVVGINPKRGCRVSVEKNKITIEPETKSQTLDDEVAGSMVRFMKKYRSDLTKLAS